MTLLAVLLLAAPLAEAKVEEKLGAPLPPDLEFTDHRGESIRFSDLTGHRPIVLVLAYYRCPMLCSLVQNGVARLLAKSEAQLGRDFELVTISFDPEETPADASKRRTRDDRWRFLVGDRRSIDRLLAATGVSVAKDRSTGQWAHPAVFLVLTPDGRVSRYFYGFDVAPSDFELALAEAARGTTGPSFAQILMRCFSYDPAKRRYAGIIANAFRAGGVVLFIAVFGGVGLLFRMEKRRRA